MIVPETHAEEAGKSPPASAAGSAPRLRHRRSLPVSAAAGIAMFPADGGERRPSCSRADLDLFAAKRQKRAA